MYDYLIVGAGLFGSVFGREMREHGKSVLVIDKRSHIGGNVYTETKENIPVHVFGPHLFHCNSPEIWQYVNRFTSFNNYQHRVKANYKGKLYSLPFNMNTFYELWGVLTPAEAQKKLESVKVKIDKPRNLEEWVLSQLGEEIYTKLIYGYTKKQWFCEPRELPASIIKRLPIRFTYDDNYFNDAYQGVPINGYTGMMNNILDGLEVKENTDFFDIKDWRTIAKKLIYSGAIDELGGYQFGELEYLTLAFRHEIVDGNFQGIGQMNYTDSDVPYTRIVEHKHFHHSKSDKSTITYEYPVEWKRGKIPYYPINTEKNNAIYKKYEEHFKKQDDILISGRLGKFLYYNMDQILGMALNQAKKELNLT